MKLVRNIFFGIGTLSAVILVVISIGILAVIFLITFPGNSRDNANPAKQAEMIDLSMKWGQLAAFPASARNFHIQTEGSAFTRTFRGTFDARPEVVLKWLKTSPGIREGTSKVQPDKSIKYILKTADGASYGEVIVSKNKSHVSFYIEWS